MTKLKLVNQGRVLVQREGKKIVVRFPNGSKRAFNSARRAERAAKDWFRRRAPRDCAGLGEIEWR
jgi:hypothetical protein